MSQGHCRNLSCRQGNHKEFLCPGAYGVFNMRTGEIQSRVAPGILTSSFKFWCKIKMHSDKSYKCPVTFSPDLPHCDSPSLSYHPILHSEA